MGLNERCIDVDNARLWVGDSGAGPPVMLCNGGPGCCDYLEPIATMIDDITHVYRWEQRGCGRSVQTGPFDLATAIDDLEHLRIALDHEKWIIGGHSWGANLAHIYALTYPQRSAGLLFLSGTGIDNEWREAYHHNKTIRTERLPEFKYLTNLEVNRVGNESHRRFLDDPTLIERTKQLKTPALIVHGEDDLRPPVSARRLSEWMPRAEFVLIEGAEHCLWFTHAQELRKLLRDWLGKTIVEK